ncbi:MAG: hypothetical protein ACFFBI_00360 [Promethearchaeota archaeon]
MRIIGISLSSNQLIHLCCYKEYVNELNMFTSEVVQHVTIKYKIEIIKDPKKAVEEVFKIKKCGIKFIGTKYFVLSFPIDSLHNPIDCQVNIVSLTFFFINKDKSIIPINHISQFLEIPKQNKDHLEYLLDSEIKNQEKDLKRSVNSKTVQLKDSYDNLKKPKKSKDFLCDSYRLFKERIQDLELLNTKPDFIHKSMKKFGISLLCMVLLFVKCVNNLMENEFQNDLNDFLKNNIFEKSQSEVTV